RLRHRRRHRHLRRRVPLQLSNAGADARIPPHATPGKPRIAGLFFFLLPLRGRPGERVSCAAPPALAERTFACSMHPGRPRSRATMNGGRNTDSVIHISPEPPLSPPCPTPRPVPPGRMRSSTSAPLEREHVLPSHGGRRTGSACVGHTTATTPPFFTNAMPPSRLSAIARIGAQKEQPMPRGDKSSYTDKQKRQAEHIEESAKDQGRNEETAERIAWATVNKQDGGGRKSGSGRKTGARKATKKTARKATKKTAAKKSSSGGAKKAMKKATRKTARKSA